MRYLSPHLTRLAEIERLFSRKDLKRVCEAPELSFGPAYDMERVLCDQPGPENYYFFKDNGSNVLAVAHLDTVIHPEDRTCRFVMTEGAGTVVFSGALDDRLGAYIILELLPLLGLTYDVLLTVGEESGQSTAGFFQPPSGKDYNHIIEFDRGGTDVVMYQYEDNEVRQLVKNCGARVGVGSFSDVSYLEHLEVKGFNWGVGYQDYHGPRGHAFLEDTFEMVAKYLVFAEQNEGVYMPHYPADDGYPSGRGSGMWGGHHWSDDEWDDEDTPKFSHAHGHDHDEPERPAWMSDEDWAEVNEYPSLDEINAELDRVMMDDRA